MSENQTKQNDNNNEISIKELIEVIWNKKIFIGIVAISVFIVAVIGSMIYDNRTTNMVLFINVEWEGIDVGEYPDGSTFDYNQAITPDVLSQSITELDMDITSSELREATEIIPIIPADIATILQNALEDGEQMNYFATNYKVVMDYNALGISASQADDLLMTIVHKFEEDIESKFVYSEQVFNFTNIDFEDYDYIDAYVILESQVKLITDLMTEKNIENPEFTSKTVSQGFSDILVRTELIDTVKIEEIKSRVNTYLLSKDSDYLITKYNYIIEDKTLQLNKALLRETDLQLLVDNYNGSVTTIIVPGVDSQTVLEIDTYYELLLENLVVTQSNVAELQEDIAYYEMLIERIEGTSPDFSITPAKKAEETQRVEELITESSQELGDIVADSNALLIDYMDYRISTIISPLTTPQTVSNVSVALYSIVALVVGVGAGTVVVLFKHDWK